MKLTVRESMILSLLAQDLSVKQIAYHINRSIHTVTAQVKSAELKLHCYTDHGAVAKYLKQHASDIN